VATADSGTSQVPGTHVLDPAVREAVESILKDLEKAYREGDAEAIITFCDNETLFQRVVDSGLINLDGLDPEQCSKIKLEYIQNLRDAWVRSSGKDVIANLENHHIEHGVDESISVYTTSFNRVTELEDRTSWHLKSDLDGDWKFHDSSGADGFLGSAWYGMNSTSNAAAPWTGPIEALDKLLSDLSREDLDGDPWGLVTFADRALDSSPPPEVAAMVVQLRAQGFLIADDLEDALEDLDKVEKLSGRNAVLLELRATCHSGIEEYALALESLKPLEERFPLDAYMHAIAAECYLLEGQPDMAAYHANLCLRTYEESGIALTTLALVLNESDFHEIRDCIHATAGPEGSYKLILETATSWEDRQVVEWTLTLLKADFPESELLKTYSKE
jgi:hypothetical protein